ALDSLQVRFKKFGEQSMQPAVTLHSALRRLKRHTESIAVLESAMTLRPDDAELKLSVVQSLMATSGEYWPRAEALLASVKDAAPERQWHEAASEMAVTRGEWKEGLEHLERLLPRSPFSMSLREQISDLIAQTEGEAAVIARWQSAAEEFPHYQPLQERYAMALRGRPLEEIQPVLERILNKTPDNAWAVRELAQHLLFAGKLEESEKSIARAVELDAENTFVASLQATLESKRGDNAAARARLRRLLKKDISDEFLVTKLLDSCDSVEEQQAELNWVLDELRRQPMTGDVLMIYRDYAESVMPAEDLLEVLREAVQLRPDLWQSHQAWIRQLTHMQAFKEAEAAADTAIDEFPFEPNAWFEKYRVASAIGDVATQRATLERCELLRPSNPAVVRALSDVLCSEGAFGEARNILEQLVARQPLDAVTRGYLADILAELDETELALEQYEQAVRLEPDYDYAWGRLESIANVLERPNYRLAVAQRIAEEKPHECGAWVELSRSLGFDEQFDEAHEALNRAEEIEPYREAVHTGRARLFLNAGDYSSAMSALQPPIYHTMPAALESTRAQILWDVGQQDEAYELIQSAAAENPGHIGIWSRLEQWAMIRGDREEAIRAIEHQVQTQPFDADVLDSAGNAFAALDEMEKAKSTLRRTIAIAPGYAGSRCHLFDLLIADEQWDEARGIIRDLPRCDQHPTVIARRMQVSVHDEDHQQAWEDFEAILDNEEWSSWAVDHAVEMMSELGKEDLVQRRIEEAIAGPDANAELGRVWASLQFAGVDSPSTDLYQRIADRVRELIQSDNPHLGYAAMSALVPVLTQEGREDDLRSFIRRNQEWIVGDTHCWTLVAYAYADNPTAVKKKQIRDWIRDWRDREDYEPWMLTNVHELCRIVGDAQGGRDAVQLALSMPPDHMQSQLRLWAAHDALFDGDAQLALKHFMGAARLEHLEGMDRLLHHWVEVVVHAQQASDKREAFRQVKQQLAETGVTAKFFSSQPAYRLPYQRTLEMVAKAIGTPSAKLWSSAKIARLKLVQFGLT
ncbi:MAG: tetratricopeptide repeat protein, partial [Rubripirellula sp.]